MNKQTVNQFIKEFGSRIGSGYFKENEILAKHTSFQIGGSACLYIEIVKTADLIDVLKYVLTKKIPHIIIGGGTNLLIPDKGYPGICIKNNTNKIIIKKYSGSFSKNKVQQGHVELEVLSGTSMNQLVRFTLEEGLSGLEAFLGLPGTVGGAVYMNAHNIKMHEQFGDKITNAEIITEKGQIATVDKSYFKFGYDKSILQQYKQIVLKVTIKLLKADQRLIWAKANKALDNRRASQPWNFPSAGCIFKNISMADALRLGTPNNTTSAGFLIQSAGLKNFRIGKARFSDKHANFIVNDGGAKYSDVLQLINIAKEKVKKRYGITLEEEIVILKEEN